MKSYRLFILFLVGLGCYNNCHAQDDKKQLATGSVFSPRNDSAVHAKENIPKKTKLSPTDSIMMAHSPRIATRRALILPGWGQAYNKEYWKIPIVYGILAIPTIAYFYNNSYYKKTKFAYEAVYAATQANPIDTSMLKFIDPSVKYTNGDPLSLSSYQSYRNAYRRDRDYSILYFILAWGLQVADATVFAHLKQFDVGRDLSMEINPVFNNTTKTPGLGLVLNLKNPSSRKIFSVDH